MTKITTKFPQDLAQPIAAAYVPTDVEAGIMNWWRENEFYVADPKRALAKGKDKCFVMVIPPPNVTGSLHLGHTLTMAIQDLITRWHRMKGKETLWVPGLDHAGIATQSVVEKKIMRERGLKRQDLGREPFLKEVWAWKEESGGKIMSQLDLLGLSTDHTRLRFTMDDMLVVAVKEAFIRLFNEGHIKRKNRLVSWCSHLQTALSEIEVDTLEIAKPDRIKIPGYERTVEVGKLWHFKYAMKDDPTRFLEVATTRIETMLGDTAVAVHPEDPRFKDLIGKELIHPFVADRKMSVIADTYVSMEFGTGAVKITPSHDKNDFEIGVRHNLEMITCFTDDGKIVSGYGEFSGMHRFQCREAIVKSLEAQGLLGEIVPNTNSMSIPICSRSGDIIEYRLIPQWYFNCRDGAQASLDALTNGDLRIIPESHHSTWKRWLDNVDDWCISRQLWWGHRIPAFRLKEHDDAHGTWVVAKDATEAEKILREKHGIPAGTKCEVVQDEDVLDTWFSSGLFPFSVFGWPNVDTDEFKAFFPGFLLETGHDILFFWVARMTMMSWYLCDKQMPFKDVFLHAMVRDSHGKKMSKSLGNVLDPIDVIHGVELNTLLEQTKANHSIAEKEMKRAIDATKKDYPKGIPECGTDGLRMGLLAYLKQGRSVNLDVNRVVGYRQFCNKLWNAVKFALNYFQDDEFVLRDVADLDIPSFSMFDRNILSRLSEVADQCDKSIENYEFADYVEKIYSFFLYEFCDVYVEVVKPIFREGNQTPAAEISKQIIYRVLETSLRLLHPIVPFVTEVLYQRLPGSATLRENTISLATFPTSAELKVPFDSSDCGPKIELFMSVIKATRSCLATVELGNKKGIPLVLKCSNAETSAWLAELQDPIAFLAKVNPFDGSETASRFIAEGDSLPPGTAINTINASLEIGVVCPADTNFQKIKDKLVKKMALLDNSLASLEKKMNLPSYKERVPDNIKEADATKKVDLGADISALKVVISQFKF